MHVFCFELIIPEKLLQSWRYKVLAVIKRHKNHLFLSFIPEEEQPKDCSKR